MFAESESLNLLPIRDSEYDTFNILNKLKSSPGPRHTTKQRRSLKTNESYPTFPSFNTMSSPIARFTDDFDNSNETMIPATPVDVKSVSRVRQLSSKKLIYSYTFGSSSNSNSENCSSTTGSPERSNSRKLFSNSYDSSAKNCRQSLQLSPQFKLLELSDPSLSSQVPFYSSQKRKRKNY